MAGLRQIIRARRSGGLLAVVLAYALAIQALMASVGFGMSAGPAPGQLDFAICSAATAPSAQAPATGQDRQNPGPRPGCPFCFVAAQCAGQAATMGAAPAFPAYSGTPIPGLVSDQLADNLFVPQFRHLIGEPRAPPALSV